MIDLSADFRIKDVAVYEKWYGIEHKSPQFLAEAVYGLCEINREKIRGAQAGGQSGVLYHLFDPHRLPAGQGRD